VELAVANNSRIKITSSDIAIANETRRQAHRARGVTVQANHVSSYTDLQMENAEAIYGSTYQESYENSVTASYPLYTGGVIKNTIKRAESDHKSRKHAHEKSLQDMKQSVASALYAVFRAEDMTVLSEGSVERLVAHVDSVQIHYENGRVGKSDLLRSEVELSNARQNLIRARNDHEVAIKRLNSLMGMPLDTELKIVKAMSREKFAHTLEECIEFGRSNQPELAVAALAIESAKAEAAVARGELLPRATLTATQNLRSSTAFPGKDADSFNAALNIRYDVLDSGVRSSKIAAADESVRRAGHNYASVLDSVTLAVNSDYNGVIEAFERLEESVPTIDKAREAYAIALSRYNEGVGTNIDVVDSETALTQANSNHTQALCDYNVALASLENSMGGKFK